MMVQYIHKPAPNEARLYVYIHSYEYIHVHVLYTSDALFHSAWLFSYCNATGE